MKFEVCTLGISQENEEKVIFFIRNHSFFAKKWVKMSFPDHNDSRKVVHKVDSYLIGQFQPKVMTRSQENGENLIFGKHCL